MNLKQNTWMYLFFASVLFWLGTVTFSCEAAPETKKTAEVIEPKESNDPCKDYKPDTYQLDRSIAEDYIKRYKDYVAGNPNDEKLNNVDVRYFRLPHCELATIVDSVDEGEDMKAHLAIKNLGANDAESKEAYTGEIILVFEDTKTSTYYDFVHPCPKDCGK